MKLISLPQKPKYIKLGENAGRFEIHGCYPGYGTTLGNAIRRVLLSSLDGAAITSVKIKGVSHEFSTIPGVMEDVIQIVLNLKKVRFRSYSDEPIKATISFKGEGEMTAKEIVAPSDIEVVNLDQVIATSTDKKTQIDMEIQIEKGIGYVTVEQRDDKEKELGSIAIDAIYTPVKRVNYEIENMRVGKRTDYEKITIEIVTDGSIDPQEAFNKSVAILVDQFSALTEIDVENVVSVKSEEKSDKKIEDKPILNNKEQQDYTSISVSDLKDLSTRTLNVLEENKIGNVGDIVVMSEDQLKNLDGMGDKGIKEIKKSIGEFGLTLK